MHSPFHESAFHHGISSSVPNSLPSLMRGGSTGSHPGLTKSGHLMGHLNFDTELAQNVHPHSLPDYHDALVNGIHCHSPSTVASSVNSQSMERINGRQLCRVVSDGHTLELNEGSKFDKFSGCYVLLRWHSRGHMDFNHRLFQCYILSLVIVFLLFYW